MSLTSTLHSVPASACCIALLISSYFQPCSIILATCGCMSVSISLISCCPYFCTSFSTISLSNFFVSSSFGIRESTNALNPITNGCGLFCIASIKILIGRPGLLLLSKIFTALLNSVHFISNTWRSCFLSKAKLLVAPGLPPGPIQ